MKEPKKRDLFPDIIKGIAIILVVIGHSIQYGSGEHYFQSESFFQNPLFKIIYSFHMPLFMLISGYFFYFSCNKYSFREGVISRFTKVLLPVIVWAALYFIIKMLLNGEYLGIKATVIQYIKICITSIWFLWAVFFCSLAVLVVKHFFKDNIYVYLLLFLLTFVVPDFFIIFLYKFMYPFFVLGYLYNKYKTKITWGKQGYWLVGFLLLYIVLMRFYVYDSFIYNGQYMHYNKDIPYQLYTDIYRLVVGLVGSVLVILILQYIFKNRQNSKVAVLLGTLGVYSLGIYIITGYIQPLLLKVPFLEGFSYLNVFLVSLVVLVVSYGLTYLLRKVPVTNKLLLGGR
ncbi:acyltransferase family protein [Chitinophaga sp. SYP-B3965]|uniref:acyltransferase family protein n=1 Tax=Chitinophaga sp. SYP-B3965 TaxID=2663120 RepID=UPI001299D335|nr:acyltransferase family protein [Chitinophaga sp. SYP-B3965]MRG48656.1 acyltransferase family protein [Chitinophaga sp. SYP-B3965]